MSLFSELSPDLKRRLIYAHVAVFSMISLGTVVFRYLEGLTWTDSLYLTTATATTVGYGDLVAQTPAGKQFATFFMLFAVGTVLYALSILGQTLIKEEILFALGSRRRSKEMEKLSDHYIVCGAGRVGRRIIGSLRHEGIPFVLIESNEEKVASLESSDRDFILIGDATLEANLLSAGVERARGLATCLSDDAQNVYVVLTARDLNEDLHIVSRAVEQEAEPKLIRAGANRVVSPIIIGSHSMTRALIKPAIADFMDSIVAKNLELVFEEIPVGKSSPFLDVELRETGISGKLDVLVVAIRRQNGQMIFNPAAETRIREKDLLIVIGPAESVKKMVEASN